MAGENRIIAFGAGDGENTGAGAENERAAEGFTALPAQESWDDAWVATETQPDDLARTRGWLVPALAVLVIVAWTGLFVAGQLPAMRDGASLQQVSTVIAQWCGPVLLVGICWLLAMRTSTRESDRFGDIARTLSNEAALLETRLTKVNRELSLAREFVAAQSRDLETLGRLATERLSHNAERLEKLVQDNGARVESISTVSTAALDNMEKLRGQLPVIASSAKDVTNTIANAGRTAHAQLDDMIHGFNRLNEFGTASTRQVAALGEQVNDTLDGFNQRCEQMEQIAAARFAALAERGDEFRAQLDHHEVAALAGVRNRAKALAEEIDDTRRELDRHEAESLTSLRARLVALRDESEVVSRTLRTSESRAAETLRSSLATLAHEQAELAETISDTQHAALDALAGRLATIAAEAQQIDESIGLRAERLAMEAQERQSRQVEQERHAIARIDHMLGELDGTIAERLERHRIQAAALADRAAAVTAELGDFESTLSAIAEHTGRSETRLLGSLAALTDRLTAARSTLAATDDDLGTLTENSVRLLELVQASAKQTHNVLPEALAVSEDRLLRLQHGVGALLAQFDEAAHGGGTVASTIDASSQHLGSLLSELAHAQAQISAHGNDHAALLTRMQFNLAEIDAGIQASAARANGELSAAIAALGATLRDAVQAIESESATRIAHVAQTLGDESAAAIDKSMRTRVAEISGQLEQAVAHASGVTRETAGQLRQQLEQVGNLVDNLEARLSAAQEQAQEQVNNDFARRAAVITESLNSNAIDIATALSSDIADTAWAAYLRGDRGIFTRRAVSLLDASEAKAIQQIFERDDAFKANVSRYIHDFEAILRQVLSTRDGNALGVTLLSSDMGKLYVALAQAIERLRS
ncbi:hypothetical protein [Novosphingobium sp. Leaf2]|uniref:hypothetical protein n=1 Tax=Novosphingobium sp. Leaf2 TaxID=1735670 RepID=UPI0006F30A2C|nr:hypothetical protein [Novosphingobium sp. Leaf2]KQM17383.1 ATPase [Novosphingobium sp. Leaf2]